MNYNKQVENQVLKYLKDKPENRKSIAFYGKGGMGKTHLKYKLMPQLKDAGYTNFYSEDEYDLPYSLGADTRNVKRRNTWVVCTRNEDILKDDRFMVFHLMTNY
jgi:hypothetical protein